MLFTMFTRLKYHRSRAWQIVLILNTAFKFLGSAGIVNATVYKNKISIVLILNTVFNIIHQLACLIHWLHAYRKLQCPFFLSRKCKPAVCNMVAISFELHVEARLQKLINFQNAALSCDNCQSFWVILFYSIEISDNLTNFEETLPDSDDNLNVPAQRPCMGHIYIHIYILYIWDWHLMGWWKTTK